MDALIMSMPEVTQAACTLLSLHSRGANKFLTGHQPLVLQAGYQHAAL